MDALKKNKKTILIAAGGALGGAILVAGVLLLVSALGGDGSEEDPAVEQLEIAAGTLKLSEDIGELAVAVANGEQTSKRSDDARDEATELIGAASVLDEAPARSLRRANENNLDSAAELDAIEQEMSDGRTAIDEEDEASEEASDRLAGLSEGVAALDDRIEASKRRATEALSELQQALAALSTELESSDDVSDEARAQLESVEQNVQDLERDLAGSFEDLAAAADALGSELANESEALEPDIVLDCPELAATQGAGLYNVSVRNISCSEAGAALGAYGPPTGFACTELTSGYEFTEYRCTRGDQAIRYGVGA